MKNSAFSANPSAKGNSSVHSYSPSTDSPFRVAPVIAASSLGLVMYSQMPHCSHSASPGRSPFSRNFTSSSGDTSLLVMHMHWRRPASWRFRRITACADVPDPAKKSRTTASGLLPTKNRRTSSTPYRDFEYGNRRPGISLESIRVPPASAL